MAYPCWHPHAKSLSGVQPEVWEKGGCKLFMTVQHVSCHNTFVNWTKNLKKVKINVNLHFKHSFHKVVNCNQILGCATKDHFQGQDCENFDDEKLKKF